MIRLLFIIGFAAAVWWTLTPQPERVRENGILVSTIPEQVTVNRPLYLNNDGSFSGYSIQALASYHIKARVLSKEFYYSGKEADLSSYDLALGWQNMSNSAVLNKLDIGQANRWYRYRWQSPPPLDPKEIARTSANVHTIPANNEVSEQLKKVKKGDVVRMIGYLVNVSNDDDWQWRSSLTRHDQGAKACELMWVESISIE